jgi:transcriptional regulator with XRE-family HTH domain
MINQLASELKQLREIRGYSLRQVEKATGVSNAYLSQLERGDAAKPSPDKLARLAKFYDVSYEQLMVLAGYLGSTVATLTEHGQRAALIGVARPKVDKKEKTGILKDALTKADLNEDELRLVADYVAFLTTRRKKYGRQRAQ